MVFEGDPRSFMYYNEQYYINGTVVEISEAYRNINNFYGKKIWKYAIFDHKISSANGISYFFCITKVDELSAQRINVNEYAPYFTVPAWLIDSAVKTIIKPIKLSETECEAIQNGLINAIQNPKYNLRYPKLRFAWMIYVIVLVVSLIFKQFYIVWIIASFIFYKWRKGILKL